MNCQQAATLIDAYLDGELDLTTCVALEQHLATCPACREKLELRRALVTHVREEAPRYQASPFLATRIRAALRAEEPETGRVSAAWLARWLTYGLAGALAILAVVAVLARSSPFPALAEDAIADHVRSLQVNHLVDVASTDQHTVKPWFAGKLDYSPQVIDLTPSGYPLIGGRLDVLDHRDVAAIIYQRRKHYINLFIWPAAKEFSGDRVYEENGYHVIAWTKSGMNYLAVSELGEKELRDFTEMIKDQIVPPME